MISLVCRTLKSASCRARRRSFTIAASSASSIFLRDRMRPSARMIPEVRPSSAM